MITKLKVFTLLVLLCSTASYAQSTGTAFEGEIVYACTYKTKNPKMKAETLAAMLGKEHNYFIKGGDYKMEINGVFAQWQIFINKDNKLYNKMASSDTVFWNDTRMHNDQLLNVKVNKNALTVLGYLCDELILTCASGVHKYYYNSKLPVDGELYANHAYGNYYNYISRANAIPLKMILEDNDFTMESTATKVTPKKLPAGFFNLPANTKTAESLY
jgi:hypothetical protein